MNPEVWKPIKGYESYLSVSNYGNVKIAQRRVRNGRSYRIIDEKILSVILIGKEYSYPYVGCCIDGEKVNINVARAVYEAFNSITLSLRMTVRHKDGNKMNNHIDNIKVISRRSLTPSTLNETGRTGVTKSGNQYVASIVFEEKRITIHRSENKDECHKIYQLAKTMFDEYEKLKLGILSNSRLNNKLIVKSVLLP